MSCEIRLLHRPRLCRRQRWDAGILHQSWRESRTAALSSSPRRVAAATRSILPLDLFKRYSKLSFPLGGCIAENTW